jgi:hypothetical protein
MDGIMRRYVGLFLLVFLLEGATASAQTYGGAATASADSSSTDISRLPPTQDASDAGSSTWQPPSIRPDDGADSQSLSDQKLRELQAHPHSVWTVQADALWLQRSAGSNLFLGETAIGGSPGPTVDTLSAGDANFKFQPGVRLALGLRASDFISWELLYFGLQNWNSSQTIFPDPFNAGTLAISPYTQVDKLIGGFDQSLGYTYSSQLHNAEFNGRYTLLNQGPWLLQGLAGFRYLQWNENFNLTGVDQFYGVTENINSRTHNYLVGAQIGGDMRADWRRFSFAMTGKAALFANFIQAQQSNLGSSGLSNVPGGGILPIDSSNHMTGVAEVLDFSAIATYRIGQHVALRGGYQLLYVNGLALAPNQLSGSSHSGGVFLQGPTAGLEINW